MHQDAANADRTQQSFEQPCEKTLLEDLIQQTAVRNLTVREAHDLPRQVYTGRSSETGTDKRGISLWRSLARMVFGRNVPGHKNESSAKMKGLLRARMLARSRGTQVRRQSQSLLLLSEELKGKYQLRRGTLEKRVTASEIIPQDSGGRMPMLLIHPYSHVRLAWDTLIMLLLVYSLVSLPVYLAFKKSPAECNQSFTQQSTTFYVDFCFDTIFILDIIVTFRTAYVEDRHHRPKLITDPCRIAWNYIRGVLILDIMASIPYEVLMLLVCEDLSDANGLMRGPKVMKLLKVARIMRIMRINKLKQFLSKLRDILRLNPGVMKLSMFLSLVLMAHHYSACLFFFIGMWPGELLCMHSNVASAVCG